MEYYNILNVPKSASEEEIKNAYKRLAKIHHPDKGGDKEKFQKIQEAYSILSDRESRNNYDNPMPNFNSNFNDNFNPFNGFHHFQQQQQSNIVKKNHHYYECKITLKDVYFGVNKKFKIKRSVLCDSCKKKCNKCKGNGNTINHIQVGPFTQMIHQKCNDCNGSGFSKIDECDLCKNGYINEEKIFEVNIERGVIPNKQYTFEGWGEQKSKSNEIPGDFIINIKIEDHPDFKRKDNHLIYEILLTFKESIIGKSVIIPHFDKEIELDTSGFGIINPNKEYILFNKGFFKDNKYGNLHIIFKIEYRDRTFTKDEIKILNEIFDKVNLQ